MKIIKIMKVTIIFAFSIIAFQTGANSGNDIFDRYCTVCHSATMAPMFGSPAAHDLQAWNERKVAAFIKAVAENPSFNNVSEEMKNDIMIKTLVISAKDGTEKGMPPMGTCMDCTDKDLKAAIEFMSSSEN
jgi:cytochrome c5